jgi:putative phosphoesterase
MVTTMGYRLAIVSDIHADLHALEDALRAIDAMRPDAIVCAGDLVDYGLFPDETLALLASRKIPCVRGNHDRWVVEAKGHGGWDFTSASRKFLAALPLSWERVLEGVRVAVHHASPRRDMDGISPLEIDVAYARSLLDRAEADVLVVGHTHIAFRLELPGRGVIVNPAALLRAPAEAADNPPATGTFGILDLPSCAFTVHRAGDGAEVSILRRKL